MLKFQRHQPATCASADEGNLLRMADCSTTDIKQQWKALPSSLSPGSIRLQSVANPTLCILGEGESHGKGDNARWPPQQQFHQAATFAHLIGANDTWVNLDDLPIGHMTLQGCNPQTLGPCVWSEPQQRSVFTLYCMVRSPIMFSGDMPTDEATLKIVTNTKVLAIQHASRNNRQISNVVAAATSPGGCKAANTSYKCNEVVWAADDGSGGQYVALFWTGSGNRTVTVPVVSVRSSAATVHDLWNGEKSEVEAGGSLTAHLQGGDVALFRLTHPPRTKAKA
jgi:hypothetical protein